MTSRHFRFLLLASLSVAAGVATAQSSEAAEPFEPVAARKITYEQLVAKYADADSKFVVLEGVDGIRVHYKEEGSGPAVLLVHSSSGDLKDWDTWVRVLSKDYRVVRLDLPSFGLTGPVPSGNYSIDRYLSLVDALMDHLGLERFAIVGTSYGGLVAFRYAGTRLDRVTALILANSAGIEYGGRLGRTERIREPAPRFTPHLRTLQETDTMLNTVINDPAKVTAKFVQRKTDYANLVGRDYEGFLGTQLYERGNPQRVLGHVRAPALVLWGGDSRGLSPQTAQAFVDAMKNAKSTQKIIYDGGGHLLHIERPEQTVKDVKIFLDRQLRGR
jgi:pimeloyl-ACP methyl ester carboxylesterase